MDAIYNLMGMILCLLFGWEEIMATNNIDLYMKIKGSLINNGIKVQSSIMDAYSVRSSSHLDGHHRINAMYYIYVKKEKLHIAKKIVDEQRI